MNIIATTTLRENLAQSLATVSGKKDYLLISKKGKVSSAIVNIDLFEDLLLLADKNYLEEIKNARREYEKGDYFTHDQVFGSL